MTDEPGLRERKKLRTAELISQTAISLFLRRGFDHVSVAEVAAAAEVSKKTVFNYFPAKEDLVFHPLRDHVDESARIARSREPGQSPVAALRRHFLAGLAAGDPVTGLAGYEEFLAFQRMVMRTPSLKLRLMEQWIRSEDSLAEALAEAFAEALDGSLGTWPDASRKAAPDASPDVSPDASQDGSQDVSQDRAGNPAAGVVAQTLAGQIIAVQRVLTVRNVERMLAGRRPEDVLAQATAEAEVAFDLLEKTLR